jgi:hypothetical protein
MDSSVFDNSRENIQPSVAIVLPPRKMGGLANGLVDLTEAIAERDADAVAHGLLGGKFGYGGHWDDDLFMMHPYCWCEREDCPWCAGCDCPPSASHYFVDGVEVEYQEYANFFDRETGGLKFRLSDREHRAWIAKADAANKRRTARHDPVCDYCLSKGAFALYPAGHSAPHFWHKPSGLMVWWYKYIGRGMEAMGANDKLDVRGIINECIARVKIAPPTVASGLNETSKHRGIQTKAGHGEYRWPMKR